MNTDLMYKLLKYLCHGVIIYLLFKYVPKQPMEDQDVLLITAIVVLLYAVIENACAIYWTSDNNNSATSQLLTLGQCNSKCTMTPKTEHLESVGADKEHLESLSSLIPTVTSTVAQPVETKQDEKKPEATDGYKMEVQPNPQITAIGSRAQDGVLDNEMGYTDFSEASSGGYVDYNNFPKHDLETAEFEYGHSFLPPSQWYPTPPHPPVCVSEKRCPVCPVFTTGLPADLKEWNASRRVLLPDQINVKYVQEKLNSGR